MASIPQQQQSFSMSSPPSPRLVSASGLCYWWAVQGNHCWLCLSCSWFCHCSISRCCQGQAFQQTVYFRCRWPHRLQEQSCLCWWKGRTVGPHWISRLAWKQRRHARGRRPIIKKLQSKHLWIQSHWKRAESQTKTTMVRTQWNPRRKR